MIFEKIEDFLQNIKQNKRLVALDVGRKNIGVAVSDKSWLLATPKTTVKRKSNKIDIPEILKLYKEADATGLIVGLPLNLNEEETDCSQYVRRFINSILEVNDIPVFFVNEAYTSAESEELLIDNVGIGFSKTKEIVDKMSAHYILNDFFSKVKNINGSL